MRLIVFGMSVLLCAQAWATPLEFTSTVGARGDFRFAGRGLRARPRAVERVEAVGILDPETNEIAYDPISLTLRATERQKQISRLVGVTPPMCDFFGCTPRMEIREEFTMTLNLDPITVSMEPVAVPVLSYSETTAHAGGIPRSAFSASPLSGTWTIEGPTESQSVEFRIPVRIWNRPSVGRIDVVRNPPTSGEVVAWSADLRDFRLGIRQGTIVSDVEVDGHPFSLRIIPEPGTMIMATMACGLLATCRHRRRRLQV